MLWGIYEAIVTRQCPQVILFQLCYASDELGSYNCWFCRSSPLLCIYSLSFIFSNYLNNKDHEEFQREGFNGDPKW